MATFVESYLLNSSSIQTTSANKQILLPSIALTGVQIQVLTIRGVVFTAESQGSVEIGGALVTLYDENGNAIAQTTTATAGTAIGSFTLVFEGNLNVNYSLTISADGFDPVTRPVTFTTTTSTLAILLLNNDSSLPIIYGTVTDAVTGAGVVGANVNISGTDGNQVNVTTVANGVFLSYDNYSRGVNYTVTVTALGYDGASQTVQIPTDSIGRNVIFNLEQNASNLTSIAGRIIVAGSSPAVGVADALVALYVASDEVGVTGEVVQTVLTDEFGTYTFINVDPTLSYIIRATKITQIA